jgi:hypothetical protein
MSLKRNKNAEKEQEKKTLSELFADEPNRFEFKTKKFAKDSEFLGDLKDGTFKEVWTDGKWTGTVRCFHRQCEQKPFWEQECIKINIKPSCFGLHNCWDIFLIKF